jgi:hypothetical protein
MLTSALPILSTSSESTEPADISSEEFADAPQVLVHLALLLAQVRTGRARGIAGATHDGGTEHAGFKATAT